VAKGFGMSGLVPARTKHLKIVDAVLGQNPHRLKPMPRNPLRNIFFPQHLSAKNFKYDPSICPQPVSEIESNA
jgi:hypothetical protein